MAEDKKKQEKQDETTSYGTETKKLTPRQIFWLRFAFWCLFACVLPFCFIVWRFDLFATTTKMNLGGWGIIAIGVVAIFAISLMRYVAKGMKHSMTKQIINGVCKIIIPLVLCYIIVYWLRDETKNCMQVLGCVTLCELVAIPINPMPEWKFNNHISEQDAAMDKLWDKFFSRKDSGK